MRTVTDIVDEVGKRFRTFGGGKDSEWNPLAHALKDAAPQFAAGVSVAAVVEFVAAEVQRATVAALTLPTFDLSFDPVTLEDKVTAIVRVEDLEIWKRQRLPSLQEGDGEP